MCQIFKSCLASAKRLGKGGFLHPAMEHLVMASSYRRTEKVIKRIHQLQKLIDVENANGSNSADVKSDEGIYSGSGYSSSAKDGPVFGEENLNVPENNNGSNCADVKSDKECLSDVGNEEDCAEIEPAKLNLEEFGSNEYLNDVKACICCFMDIKP